MEVSSCPAAAQIILLVSSKNSAAQRLYERMGYQLVLQAVEGSKGKVEHLEW